jgi:hypothetical protein
MNVILPILLVAFAAFGLAWGITQVIKDRVAASALRKFAKEVKQPVGFHTINELGLDALRILRDETEGKLVLVERRIMQLELDATDGRGSTGAGDVVISDDPPTAEPVGLQGGEWCCGCGYVGQAAGLPGKPCRCPKCGDEQGLTFRKVEPFEEFMREAREKI